MRSVRNITKRTAPLTVQKIPFAAQDLLNALLSLPTYRRLSILDSCGARDTSARFLIAGFDPFEIIEARGDEISCMLRGENDEQATNGDPLDVLDERLARYHIQQ